MRREELQSVNEMRPVLRVKKNVPWNTSGSLDDFTVACTYSNYLGTMSVLLYA
jgi:hypothetical protein